MKRRNETKAEKQARLDFYEGVLAVRHLFREGCWFADVVPHKCDGPIDPCHIIDKQGLRAFHKDLAMPERMYYDVRNGVPGCRAIHDRFDNRSIRVYQDELPKGLWSFIDQWEDALERPGVLQSKLDRKCPRGSRP